MGMTQLGERDRNLVRFLIDALDEDGYLSTPLAELWETLPPEYEIELEELEIALRHIQSLDPTGIGARSPQECLALQLKALPESAENRLALLIVEKHLELLAARDFLKIKRLADCDDEALKAAHALIVTLDPRPGARFSQLETRYITPDVIVKKLKGKWTAYINPDAYPRLRINRLYAEVLAQKRRGNGNLSGQLQEARWLIKNVQQRFETIHRVTQAIVDRQRAVLRAWRSGDAPAGPARDCRHSRSSRIDRVAGDQPEVHGDTARYLRIEIFFRQPCVHRYWRRLLCHRHSRADQAADWRRRWQETLVG